MKKILFALLYVGATAQLENLQALTTAQENAIEALKEYTTTIDTYYTIKTKLDKNEPLNEEEEALLSGIKLPRGREREAEASAIRWEKLKLLKEIARGTLKKKSELSADSGPDGSIFRAELPPVEIISMLTEGPVFNPPSQDLVETLKGYPQTKFEVYDKMIKTLLNADVTTGTRYNPAKINVDMANQYIERLLKEALTELPDPQEKKQLLKNFDQIIRDKSANDRDHDSSIKQDWDDLRASLKTYRQIADRAAASSNIEKDSSAWTFLSDVFNFIKNRIFSKKPSRLGDGIETNNPLGAGDTPITAGDAKSELADAQANMTEAGDDARVQAAATDRNDAIDSQRGDAIVNQDGKGGSSSSGNDGDVTGSRSRGRRNWTKGGPTTPTDPASIQAENDRLGANAQAATEDRLGRAAAGTDPQSNSDGDDGVRE